MQRRFTLRVDFSSMSPRQAQELFSARFGISPPPSLMAICGLTPGDFAVVHHRARLLGESRTKVLVEWLGKEVALRGHKSGPVGFQMPESTVCERDLC